MGGSQEERPDLLTRASERYLHGPTPLPQGLTEEQARAKYPFTAQMKDQGFAAEVDWQNGESLLNPDVVMRVFDDPAVSDRDKNMLLAVYEPSAIRAAYDEQVRASVGGEPIRGMGLLGRGLGFVNDVAGKPIRPVATTILDTLSKPANWAEQSMGVVLSYGQQSDLSLSERWQMGRLTYEAYSETGWWKMNGDKQLSEWAGQLEAGEVTMDELMEAHEGGAPDIMGKVILDPLWLLGGFPAIPKKFQAGADVAMFGKDAHFFQGFAGGFFRGLSHGVRTADIPLAGRAAINTKIALQRVPGGKFLVGDITKRRSYGVLGTVFGSGVPTTEQIYSQELARWGDDLAEGDTIERALGRYGAAKGVWDRTPEAKATLMYNHLVHVLRLADTDRPAVARLADALLTLDPDKIPKEFGTMSFGGARGQMLMHMLKQRGVNIRRWPSMTRKIVTPEVWASLTPELQKITMVGETGFQAQLHLDLHQIAFGELMQWHGVKGHIEEVTKDIVKTRPKAGSKVKPQPGAGKDVFADVGVEQLPTGAADAEETERILESVTYSRWIAEHSMLQKFTGGLKAFLGITMLNKPGFVALNYVNNGTTIMVDNGLASGGRFFLDPFGNRAIFDKKYAAIFEQDGVTYDVIKSIVGDRATAREILGVAADADAKILGVGREWILSPFVAIATKVDMGARIHAFITNYVRARNAIWKLEGVTERGQQTGYIPRVPQQLRDALGDDASDALEAEILAAGPNRSKLVTLFNNWRGIRRPNLTAEYYIGKMADAAGYKVGHDGRQGFIDSFTDNDSFTERLNEIFAAAKYNASQARSLMERLRGGMRHAEHLARRQDNLTPRPRDYASHSVAIADHEALMMERDQMHLMQLRRAMVALNGSGAADDVLRMVEDAQNELRMQRYVLNFASQNAGFANVADETLHLENIPQGMRQRVIEAVQNIQKGNTSLEDMAEAFQARHEALMSEAFFSLKGQAPTRPAGGTEEALKKAQLEYDTAELELDKLEKSGALGWDESAYARERLNRAELGLQAAEEALTEIPTAQYDMFGEFFGSIVNAERSRRLVTRTMNPQSPDEWTEVYRQLDDMFNGAAERESGLFGFEHRNPPHAIEGEVPTQGGKKSQLYQQYNRLLDFADGRMVGDMDNLKQSHETFGAPIDQGPLVGPLLYKSDVIPGINPQYYERIGETTVEALDEFEQAVIALRGVSGPIQIQVDELGELAHKAGIQTNLPLRAKASDYESILSYLKTGAQAPHPPLPQSPVSATFDNYAKGIMNSAPDANLSITKVARGMTDFTMLNYDERIGLDQWASVVYPYFFWPTRSMAHWAHRAKSRPGAAAATTMLYNGIADINEDADIPDRLKQGLRINIPFTDMDEGLSQGGPLFVDPIKIMFPLADWSVNDDPNADQAPANHWQALSQWSKVAGVGLNPFIDTALQHLGGDERALYLKYRLQSLSGPIPGPRQLQAAWSFLHTGQEPDNLLDEATKDALANGEALDEDQWKMLIGISDDETDIYRQNRVLSNMVGEFYLEGHSIEEREAFTREALNAMFTRQGPLWKRAGKISKREVGMAIVSGWILGMPVRQYPNGEATQRGIQEMHAEAEKASYSSGEGNSMVTKFYEEYPEFSVREASVAILDGGTEKSNEEIAQQLFSIDLEQINKKYTAKIEEKDAALTAIAKSGALQTDDGRKKFDVIEDERNALTQAKAAEVDDIDKRYHSRNQEASLNKNPHTRALSELETKYYEIELPEGATDIDFAAQKKAQKAFLDTLPVDPPNGYSPLRTSIDHYISQREYGAKIDKAYEEGDREKAEKLQEQRKEEVRQHTAEVTSKITRRQFQAHLDRNKRIPTLEENERDMASTQIGEYFAVKESATSLGYTNKEAAELGRVFWDAHPLLTKYYSSNPPYVDTFNDIVRFDRMEEIWDQYFAREGGSQARIDYLAMVLLELNDLRASFGLPAIALDDPYWDYEAPPPRYEGSLPQGYSQPAAATDFFQ